MEATLVDYRRLLGWAKRFGQRRWPVETLVVSVGTWRSGWSREAATVVNVPCFRRATMARAESLAAAKHYQLLG